MDNVQMVERLKDIFELLNVPKRSTPRTRVYDVDKIDEFLDGLESVINELGGSIYE